MAAVKTAKQIQQEFAEAQAKERSERLDLWGTYNEDNFRILLDHLLILIPDVPGFGEDIQRRNDMLDQKRYSIAAALWRQKNARELLIVNIIHVVCTKYSRNQLIALDETENSTHLLFRIKKRNSLETGFGYIYIFVDDHARVYQNWDDYICNNYLPEGVLVAPAGGFYDLDENNDVRLECAFTPASQNFLNNKEINKIAGILGLAAASATVISLVRPLPACIMTGASMAGICVTIWSASSNVLHLIDRRNHEQSIGILRKDCREIWLSLSGSLFAVATRNANALLKNSVSLSSDVSWISQNAVNGLNIGAIAISCVNVYNSAFEIINRRINNRSISPVDLLQLGVSAYLVTNSMYNFQSASRIIEMRRNQLKLEHETKMLAENASKELQHRKTETNTETNLNYSTITNMDSPKTHPVINKLIEHGLTPLKPNLELKIDEVARDNNLVDSSKTKLTLSNEMQHQETIANANTDMNHSKITNMDSLKTHPVVNQLLENELKPLKPNFELRIEVVGGNNLVDSSKIKLVLLPPKSAIQSESPVPPPSNHQESKNIRISLEAQPPPELNTTTKSVSAAETYETKNVRINLGAQPPPELNTTTKSVSAAENDTTPKVMLAENASNEMQHQETVANADTNMNSTITNMDSLKTHPVVKELMENGLKPLKPNFKLRIEDARDINLVDSSKIKLDPLDSKSSIQSDSNVPPPSMHQESENTSNVRINREDPTKPPPEINATTKSASPEGSDTTSNFNFWKIMGYVKGNSVYYYKACENMVRKYTVEDSQTKPTDNKTKTDSESSDNSYSSYLYRITGACYNYTKYSASKCYEYSKGPVGYCYSGLKSFFSKPKNDD